MSSDILLALRQVLPGLSSILQASVPLGREKPEKVAFPRFSMAASISRMELMSSGLNPITSIAFCRGGGRYLNMYVHNSLKSVLMYVVSMCMCMSMRTMVVVNCLSSSIVST